tara:strand:+ start:1352 stop:1522 length:171 start_codon:yes stop_codon:yes gene_type:complete
MSELDRDGDVIDWRSVACSFYHACGGWPAGCGNLESVDNLCEYYSFNFDEEEEDDE